MSQRKESMIEYCIRKMSLEFISKTKNVYRDSLKRHDLKELNNKISQLVQERILNNS